MFSLKQASSRAECVAELTDDVVDHLVSKRNAINGEQRVEFGGWNYHFCSVAVELHDDYNSRFELHRAFGRAGMTESSVSQARAPEVVLAVRLGKDLHAIPIWAVEEVLPALPIESVPNCPPFVRGVVFVRGHLIPVLDAAERLGLTGHQRPLEPHIVCLRIGERLIGVEFDEALDLMELGADESLSSADIGGSPGFFSGVVEREGKIYRMLDPDKLIAPVETAALEQIPRTARRDL